MSRITCDRCQLLRIDGIICHETGCPNSGKTWSPEREEWIRYVECRECGAQIEQGESCNCQEPLDDSE